MKKDEDKPFHYLLVIGIPLAGYFIPAWAAVPIVIAAVVWVIVGLSVSAYRTGHARGQADAK